MNDTIQSALNQIDPVLPPQHQLRDLRETIRYETDAAADYVIWARCHRDSESRLFGNSLNV